MLGPASRLPLWLAPYPHVSPVEPTRTTVVKPALPCLCIALHIWSKQSCEQSTAISCMTECDWHTISFAMLRNCFCNDRSVVAVHASLCGLLMRANADNAQTVRPSVAIQQAAVYSKVSSGDLLHNGHADWRGPTPHIAGEMSKAQTCAHDRQHALMRQCVCGIGLTEVVWACPRPT